MMKMLSMRNLQKINLRHLKNFNDKAHFISASIKNKWKPISCFRFLNCKFMYKILKYFKHMPIIQPDHILIIIWNIIFMLFSIFIFLLAPVQFSFPIILED